jgi:hypothetical protein
VQDARQYAALAAALLIGALLLLGCWFYSYLTWCYPLLIIAIVQTAERADRAKVDALADSCITETSVARLPLRSG